MKHDVLKDKKCIHVTIDKETHAKLRARLFIDGLSMQQIFEEFAQCLVNGDNRATRIVEALTARQLKEALEPLAHPKAGVGTMKISELDHDAIYNLIGEDREEAVKKSK